jgi:hypothetical protein
MLPLAEARRLPLRYLQILDRPFQHPFVLLQRQQDECQLLDPILHASVPPSRSFR